MYYQLPTGKVIQLSVDDYLKLTDNDIQYLISKDSGADIANPFYGSILIKDFYEDFELDEDELPDIESFFRDFD